MGVSCHLVQTEVAGPGFIKYSANQSEQNTMWHADDSRSANAFDTKLWYGGADMALLYEVHLTVFISEKCGTEHRWTKLQGRTMNVNMNVKLLSCPRWPRSLRRHRTHRNRAGEVRTTSYWVQMIHCRMSYFLKHSSEAVNQRWWYCQVYLRSRARDSNGVDRGVAAGGCCIRTDVI